MALAVQVLHFIVINAGMREDILAMAQDFRKESRFRRTGRLRRISKGFLPQCCRRGRTQLSSHDSIECRLRLCGRLRKVTSLPAGSLALCRLLLIQAALGKFVRGLQILGGEIDAGSLRCRAVVVDNNRTVPPFTVAVTAVVLVLVMLATQPPAVPVPVQSWVSPKKKKSVPRVVPILGLKNSDHPVQRAAVEVRSCSENEGVECMVRPVNPKANCQGVVSAAPVPQSRITPVEGSL